jgi:hypothetical protein
MYGAPAEARLLRILLIDIRTQNYISWGHTVLLSLLHKGRPTSFLANYEVNILLGSGLINKIERVTMVHFS